MSAINSDLYQRRHRRFWKEPRLCELCGRSTRIGYWLWRSKNRPLALCPLCKPCAKGANRKTEVTLWGLIVARTHTAPALRQ
jgi:hypothetical protein